MVEANNAVNNTIGASLSGLTNTLTITNPSNTASSAARKTISVGGATAGDPTLNFNIAGVQDWEFGIDNSASDSLIVSEGTALGTNNTWVMNVSGQRLMPMQSLFAAYRSTNVLNITGDGTTYTVIYNVEDVDQNSNYNNTTGIFTAPETGRYLFSSSTGLINIPAAASFGFTALVTTSTSYRGTLDHPGITRNSAFGRTYFNYIIAPMTAGDTARVQVTVSGTSKIVGLEGGGLISSYFCAYLIT